LFDRWSGLIPADARSRLVRKLIASLPAEHQYRLGLMTMAGSLVNLARNGYRPGLIVDVGAHKGDWALLAAEVFPQASIIMVEADSEREPQLRAVAAALGSRGRLHLTLLGPEPKADVVFHSMGMGSSVLEELTSTPRLQKHLPMQTLDALLADAAPPEGSSLLLKLDVQGYELEVLRGGVRTLAAADVLVSEVSLLPYNRDAPLMVEVLAYLDQNGFAPYDLAGTVRRFEDAALYQGDMVFARKEHPLRASKAFWKHV
jgi:FkbM family methyltransferase